MKGKFLRSLVIASCLVLGINGFAMASESVDIIPPTGRLAVISSAVVKDNVSYVESDKVTIQIFAQDNASQDIKYYLNTTPLTDPVNTDDSVWHDYYDGVTENITINSNEAQTVYLVLKDAAGNTSTVYKDANTEYTVTYNANGGINAPAAEKCYYGMPFNVSNKKPTYEGKYFLGWSTSQGATDASYFQGSIIPADIFTDTKKEITLYAVWADNAKELPLLASKVKVGDYVNYPVYYENVATSDGKYIANSNGWRVLSIEDDGTVNLVSAGVPLTYYHKSGKSKESVQNLVMNFLNVEYGTTDLTYRNTGFSPYKTLTEIFTNEFTAVYEENKTIKYNTIYKDGTEVEYTGEKKVGDLKVRAMTKEDLDKIYDATGKTKTEIGTYIKDAKYGDMLAIPSNNNYTYYWLASPSSANSLWFAYGSNGSVNGVGDYVFGIRPVVSINPLVKTTGTDMTGAWDLSFEKQEVRLDANGGEIDGEETLKITATEGNMFGTLPTPTRRGYTFEGWFTDKTGGTEITASTVVTNDASKQKLYARWDRIMDLIPSIANEPVLGDGMQAVYWQGDNGTGETTAAKHTSAMYSYVMGDGMKDSKDSKWANAVTEDGSYWVWIPRYAYKITYTNANQTAITTDRANGVIDILFMDGTSNTHYRDANGNSVALPEGYVVHPAFQAMTTTEDLESNPLGKWDAELEGIWVAKYEASQETLVDGKWQASGTQSNYGGGNVATTATTRIVSKPSRLSWRSITESNIYKNSQNMYSSLNSHEMKNSEWGAVAYLTYSAYGRNGNEVGINQNYLGTYSDGTLLPGYTGAGPGGTADVQGTTYEYDATTFGSTYAWHTEQGKKASSTGNIYGIYDLSGGAWEYMAAYVNNGHSYLQTYGANLVNSTDMKTKQVYKASATDGPSDTRPENYALNSGVYGDAVYETSTTGNSSSGGWNGDYSDFPYSSHPFFRRGADVSYGSSAGVFTFVTYGGYGYGYDGFRVVLCVQSGT